jgi:hypothetical protein
MDKDTKLNDEQQALLDLCVDSSFLEHLTPEELDRELRSVGVDPRQEPAWRRRALAFLEREIAQKRPDQDAYVKLAAAEHPQAESPSLVLDAGDFRFLYGGGPPARIYLEGPVPESANAIAIGDRDYRLVREPDRAVIEGLGRAALQRHRRNHPDLAGAQLFVFLTRKDGE